MLFHVSYQVSPERRSTAQDRFKETGGLPPTEVTIRGRWHSVSGLAGFTLVEASDPQAIAKWLQDWTDILTFEVTPVLTDEQFAQVIG